MSVDHTHLQADLPDQAQLAATTTTPLARFVPMAAAIADQAVDQWVERELRRGRSRMRAGVIILALVAVAAIPLVFLVRWMERGS